MKLSVMIFAIICSCMLAAQSYAELPNLQMTMTLVNQSKETLSYAGFSNNNPESIFLVSPKVVLPGSTVTITSISNDYNFADLSADFHFVDTKGKDHLFHMNDPQRLHYEHSTLMTQDAKVLQEMKETSQQGLALSYSSLL